MRSWRINLFYSSRYVWLLSLVTFLLMCSQDLSAQCRGPRCQPKTPKPAKPNSNDSFWGAPSWGGPDADPKDFFPDSNEEDSSGSSANGSSDSQSSTQGSSNSGSPTSETSAGGVSGGQGGAPQDRGGDHPEPLEGSVDFVPYHPPRREDFARLDDLRISGEEVADTMHRTLQRLNHAMATYGGAAAYQVANPGGQILNRELMGYENMPRANPYHSAGNEYDDVSHLHPQAFWREYKKDSIAILGRNFANCVEPRFVAKYDQPDPTGTYYSACEANCGPLCPDGHPWAYNDNLRPCFCCPSPLNRRECVRNDWYVVEYYWPEAVVTVGPKLGFITFNPLEFGYQNREDWVRRELMEDNRDEQEQQQLDEDLPRKGIDTDLWKDPYWRSGEFEYQEGFLGMRLTRANFEWRAADDRPELYWQGYLENDKCINWALPKRTSQKNVLFNTSEQGELYYLTTDPVYADLQDLLQGGDYERLVSAVTNYSLFRTPHDDSYQHSLYPSHLMALGREDGLGDVYQELERIEIRERSGGRRMRDIVLRRSGLALMPAEDNSEFIPTLSQHARRAAAAVEMFTDPRTPYADSQHRPGRASNHVDRFETQTYEGETTRPESRGKIYKLSRLYPRVGEDDPHAREPEDMPECFFPENIPNYETDSDDALWPKDLMQYHHMGETRWVYWNKRIYCSCQRRGCYKGCLTLHDGDVEEDQFHGTEPVPDDEEVNAIYVGLPNFKAYAREEGPPDCFVEDNSGVQLHERIKQGEPGPYPGAWEAPTGSGSGEAQVPGLLSFVCFGLPLSDPIPEPGAGTVARLVVRYFNPVNWLPSRGSPQNDQVILESTGPSYICSSKSCREKAGEQKRTVRKTCRCDKEKGLYTCKEDSFSVFRTRSGESFARDHSQQEETRTPSGASSYCKLLTNSPGICGGGGGEGGGGSTGGGDSSGLGDILDGASPIEGWGPTEGGGLFGRTRARAKSGLGNLLDENHSKQKNCPFCRNSGTK